MENQEVEAQVENTTAQAEQPQTQENAGPDLNVSDLASIKNIIEVATQRGAFKAQELEAVGKVFNKLDTFLNAVAKKDEE